MTTKKETKPPLVIIEPYETLQPCRSRIIAGGVMVVVAFALIFVISG